MFTRPDNSVYPSTSISPDIDLAELGARLTANRLRRDGRVVMIEDFHDGLSWEYTSTATQIGAYTRYGTMYPFTPPGMLVIRPTVGIEATAEKMTPMITEPVIGLEIVVAQDNNWLPQSVNQYGMRLYGLGCDARFRVNTITAQFEYYDNLGAWQTIPGSSFITLYGWCDFKMVIDTSLQEYKRIYFNRNKFDMTGIKVNSGGPSDNMKVILNAVSGAVTAVGAVFDSAILTTDEG